MTLSAGPVRALSPSDLDSLYKNAVWYVGGGGCAAASDTSNLVGTDGLQRSFNYFVGRGLSPVAAAAIVGNFWWESGGVDPTSQQDGSKDPFPKNGVGFGIAQWTFTARQQPLVDFAKAAGRPVTDLGVQLDFAWQEITTGNTALLSRLKAYTSADQISVATNDVMLNYEAPSTDPAVARFDKRLEGANLALRLYGGTVVTAGAASPTGGSSGCTISGVVSCSDPALSGLSPVRQAVVCTAQAELQSWQSGQSSCYKYTTGAPQAGACEEWCADFVSWVYKRANYPFTGGQSGGWRLAGVYEIRSLGQQNGNFHWHPEKTYTPKPGDIAIYSNDHHTNIVTAISGGSITIIGGNQSDQVSQETAASDLVGYVTPD